MEDLSPDIARLFAAKEARRHRLAGLPFPEKVRLVVQLQRMVAPILRARGRQVRVWSIERTTEQHFDHHDNPNALHTVSPSARKSASKAKQGMSASRVVTTTKERASQKESR